MQLVDRLILELKPKIYKQSLFNKIYPNEFDIDEYINNDDYNDIKLIIECVDNKKLIFNHFNNYNWARVLIEAGINVDLQNEIGNTMLHFANQHLTEKLIEVGANVDIKNDLGQSPLMTIFTVDRNKEKHLILEYVEASVKKVKILMDANANINIRDYNDNTIIHYVVNCDWACEFLKIFIEAGVDINAKNNNDFTPIKIAMFSGFKTRFDYKKFISILSE